jgi:hypothetical protein
MFDPLLLFPFLVALLSIGIIYAYTAAAERRFESLAMSVNIFALLQGLTILGTKLLSITLNSDTKANFTPFIWLIVSVCILLLLGVIQIIVVTGRKLKTNDHIEDILRNNAINKNDPRLALIIEAAKEIIDEDFFPNSFPENVIGAKARRRKRFFDILPDDLFDKSNPTRFSAETFCLPIEKRRGARVISLVLGLGAIFVLAWMMISI